MKTDGIVLILLLCAAGMVCANETKVVADGKLRFEVPEHEMLDFGWEEDDPAKVRVSVECLGNEDIKTREPESLSPLLYQQLVQDGYKINSANIRQLIAENDIAKSGTFSMEANYFIRSKGKIYKNYLSVSYKKLIYDGVAIGEKFLHLPSTEYDADDPFNITYHVNLVLDDRLVFISIWLLQGDAKGVGSAFPELFETRSDGKQYWVNAEAQDKFHEIFDGEEYKKLPDTIRLVRETRDAILSTLQINEGGFGEAPAKLVGWFDRVWTVGFAYEECTMPRYKKVLFLACAGNTAEDLEARGMAQAMRSVMVTDRVSTRAEQIELHIFGGMSRGQETRERLMPVHLEKLRQLAQDL